MTDPENNHHQYRYDKLLRLVEITRNGEVVATYAYNALSQRTDLWRGTQQNFVTHTKYLYNHPMKWLKAVIL